MKESLLLIDQDKKQLTRWGGQLREWGIPFHQTRDGFTALQIVQLEKIVGVICRAELPLLSGFELRRRIKKISPRLKVFLTTLKEAPRGGLSMISLEDSDSDSIVMNNRIFQQVVGVMLLSEGLLLRGGGFERFLYDQPEFKDIVGRSPAIKEVFSLIKKVSDQEVTVLIQGESGTGKELVARAIHKNSDRSDQPLIFVNCAALPETLLESELFGHEKGAFTGADTRVIGRFEQADKGCLFLDEIGDMSPATQAKVLRVCEGHEFERVGGRQKIKVDVRIIAASNRDLQKEVSRGNFREDLYYRIGAFPIFLPALHDRMEDLPLIVAHILSKYNRSASRKITGITLKAIDNMFSYRWPGNIRHLENVVSRAAILAERGIIDVSHLVPERRKESTPKEGDREKDSAGSLRSLAEVEKEAIRQALDFTGMNVSRAARGLGISRATLYKKAREYGLKIVR